LVVAAIGIVRFRRSLRGETAFTDKDWHVLFGFRKYNAMTGAVWMRVALANLIVMAAGFGIGVVLLPYGVGWMIAAMAFTVMAVVILLPKFLRSGGHNAE
jgi:hypothetical protein